MPAGTPPPVPLRTAPNYRAIVAASRAGVVGITTKGAHSDESSQEFNYRKFFKGDPFGDGSDSGRDPFWRFFREAPMPKDDVPVRGQGSGFLISADGLILTNAHVVNGAKQLTVTLADHREFPAKVIGADRSSDIAVLKIDAQGLPSERIGNSDQLAVGDYVLAIGAPFGLEETATAGIVSATGRSLPGDGYVPFIQTDAAVNPGNSGGPLFDSSGTVVGINSQIYTVSGGYQGVSFAVPINLAMQVKDQLVKNGKVEHGRLGLEVQTVSQALADSFGLKRPGGALISKVEPDSAAARAGLRSGDIILDYNGKAIASAGELSTQVNLTPPGEKAALQVWRDGKGISISPRVEAMSEEHQHELARTSQGHGRLGLALRPLTPDERDQDGVSGGLLVQGVEGRAADAGIRPGDVILSVNGHAVQSVEQLRALVHDQDKSVALLISRGNDRIYVPIELG